MPGQCCQRGWGLFLISWIPGGVQLAFEDRSAARLAFGEALEPSTTTRVALDVGRGAEQTMDASGTTFLAERDADAFGELDIKGRA